MASFTGRGPSLPASHPRRLGPALAAGWISQQWPVLYRAFQKQTEKVPVKLNKVNTPFPCSSLTGSRGRGKLQKN